ncbi:MAG: PAS domain S-box protein [Cyclobacteriaceae bacterium]
MKKIILLSLLIPVLNISQAENNEFISLQNQVAQCEVNQASVSGPNSLGGYFSSLFDTSNWPARWQCGTWSETDGWVTIISDSLIFTAYLSIPILLLFFLSRRKEIPYKRFFLLFSAFILLCGFTHLTEVIIFWDPVYRFAGFLKLLTGIVSWVTVIALAQAIPFALTFYKKETYERVEKEKNVLENQLDLFIKYTPGAMAMFDTEMHYIKASGQWYKEYGIEDDITGKSHYEVFPVLLEMPEWLDYHQRSMKGEIIKEEEYAYDNPDGSKTYIKYELRPWYKNNNDIGGIIISTEDVTDLVYARKKLESSEKRFRELLESTPEAMVILDENRIIEINNREATNLFKRPSKELNGKPLKSLFSENFDKLDKELNKYFGKKALNRTTYVEEDIICQTKSGETIPVEIVLGPIHTEGKTLVAASISDITEKKKIEKERSEINKMLEKQVSERTFELQNVNQELESFTYSVSHDLRAPLRAISGFATALEDELKDLEPETKLFLDRIIYNASKMGTLIDDLLTFSRLTRKQNELEIVNTKELIEEIIRNNDDYPDEKIEIGEIPDVSGDKSMLEVVFMNLISNAVKYSSKNAEQHISISGERSGSKAIIMIVDNGIGFDMKYSNKLFGVFQRLHTEAEFPGTGIGLALCKKIVDRHQGTIQIESEKNKGTKVTLTLKTE